MMSLITYLWDSPISLQLKPLQEVLLSTLSSIWYSLKCFNELVNLVGAYAELKRNTEWIKPFFSY